MKMRHVPTSLYIDTQFFVQNKLRFDTNAFTSLTSTFVKGGLRLLVPKVMERELYRQFSTKAEKDAKAFLEAQRDYPISLALVDLHSQEELETKCIEEKKRQWYSFKEHFVVENLPIVGNIEDVVDWYFGVLPPFSSRNGKHKEFPDAFILSVLDQYYQQHGANVAVVSKDNDFCQACKSRRYINYFEDLNEYIKAFQPEISGKERIPSEVDLTKPITTEDLTEIKTILARGDQVTSIEIQRVMNLLHGRGVRPKKDVKMAFFALRNVLSLRSVIQWRGNEGTDSWKHEQGTDDRGKNTAMQFDV